MADETAPDDEKDPAEDEAGPPPSDAPKSGETRHGVAPGAGRLRLAFASHYPASEELDALLDAFEAGNYARVREGAPTLAQRTEDPEIARAARDLASRLSPDPLAVRMLMGAGLLLLFLIYWFYTDHH